MTYGVAATTTLLAGVLGRVFGLYPTVLDALVILAVLAAALVSVAPRTKVPVARDRSGEGPDGDRSVRTEPLDADGRAADQGRLIEKHDLDPARASHLDTLSDDERVSHAGAAL